MSVNWGPWDGGMVTPALKQLFAKEGVGVIPLAEALGMFRSVLLDEDAARRAAHGVAVPACGEVRAPEPRWAVPEPPSEVLLLDAAGPIPLAADRDAWPLRPVRRLPG